MKMPEKLIELEFESDIESIRELMLLIFNNCDSLELKEKQHKEKTFNN